MRKSVQYRWIEQAEAKAVLERAAMHRNASEPHVGIIYPRTNRTGFHWLRRLRRAVLRTFVVIRSLPVNAMGRMDLGSRATSRLSDPERDDDRILVAVLMTDIVDSTKRVAEMGDHLWRVLLDRHDREARDQIKRFGGREVGSPGDGFVGIFNSPTRAVRCAATIADAIAPLGISLRCGIHVGEVHLNSGKISGLTAHIAARIAATGRPGEATVSKLARDLVAGSGIVFEDRGIHQLRGLPEELHLYAMTGVAAPATTNIINLDTRSADERQCPVRGENAPDLRGLEIVQTGE